ncbi:hypothetical protein [uncultured Methanobrevibacter sp.]|uniref:hypothetical protein n=1 Tax=uncultured Methanobrevibacter sp. TaxID=253161 RepID=UPI0025CDF9A3|nr:hypothetical protein [uncultured Methanobrevibacter sp.]
MNIIEKIIKSWWVILSIIPFINGFGILHLGFKHNNINWILEGITYEIPWMVYLLYFGMFGGLYGPATLMVAFAFVLMLVSIIRSIWIAVKLVDLYDNTDKYMFKQTELKNSSGINNNTSSNKYTNNKTNSNKNAATGCCVCIFAIFIIFAIISIFH